jgi:hypothetical protein
MLVDEVSWTETEWCKPCDDLVSKYVDAASDYRKAQAKMENNEYDLREYVAHGLAKVYIENMRAELAQSTAARDAAKVAYDAAVGAFKSRCSSGMNE